jgi:hypothetical protein
MKAEGRGEEVVGWVQRSETHLEFGDELRWWVSLRCTHPTFSHGPRLTFSNRA